MHCFHTSHKTCMAISKNKPKWETALRDKQGFKNQVFKLPHSACLFADKMPAVTWITNLSVCPSAKSLGICIANLIAARNHELLERTKYLLESCVAEISMEGFHLTPSQVLIIRLENNRPRVKFGSYCMSYRLQKNSYFKVMCDFYFWHSMPINALYKYDVKTLITWGCMESAFSLCIVIPNFSISLEFLKGE